MSPASYRAAPPRVGKDQPYASSATKPNRVLPASYAAQPSVSESVHAGNELPRFYVLHARELHQVGHHGADLSQDHDGRDGVSELKMRTSLADFSQLVL